MIDGHPGYGNGQVYDDIYELVQAGIEATDDTPRTARLCAALAAFEEHGTLGHILERIDNSAAYVRHLARAHAHEHHEID